MKGIVLAGGAGTRLDPMTRVASKQLQPVYDKPMVYYPLATLMGAGIRNILLISTPTDIPRFRHLLGDGSQWGVSIAYEVQDEPRGIAEALIIGSAFLAGEPVALILGDNIFYGNTGVPRAVASFESGATVFAYHVVDPARYGVVELEGQRVISLVEKPKQPRSTLAVPGLYLLDGQASSRADRLQPSLRGELEITDLLNSYLADGMLTALRMGRGVAWLDSGTPASLLDASNFMATIERRQGLKIACLEEVALLSGFIDTDHLQTLTETMPRSEYRQYLIAVLDEQSRTRS